MSFSPTPEQSAIVAAAQRGENLMITAYAGCAKTTTLRLIAEALDSTPFGLLVFNRKNKVDLEKIMPPHAAVYTANGLGHTAWGRAIGKKLILEERKLGKLITELARDANLELGSEAWDTVRRLVTLAMQAGIVPASYPHRPLIADTLENWANIAEDAWLDAPERLIEFSRQVLTRSVKVSFDGTITYDDQVYMSAMFNGVFPRFARFMTDESQDLSPLNHIQVARAASGQLIVVGDPKQAIYAFRGADTSSMDKLRALRKQWTDLPLATTFRCPQASVARQQEHAPGFRAAADNPQGQIIANLAAESPGGGEPTWSWPSVAALAPRSGATTSMICRNNAPVLAMAFKLLRQGVGVIVLGRDIGKNLITLSKKILPEDATTASRCVELIDSWMDEQISLARANERESKVASINDRGECLLAVLEGGAASAAELRQRLTELFARERGQVTLSTIHRCKGLEYDVVIHLDSWRIPSKFARKALDAGDPSQMQQELNLRYVGETRAKHVLAHGNVKEFV